MLEVASPRLAEEVLVGRPPQRGGARPVLARSPARASPRTIDDRNPGRLVADEVGRGGDLVGERDLGRGELAPVAVAARRASRRAAPIPAQPIATSAWPTRQGRPKLSVITTATRSAGRCREARRGAAERRRRGRPGSRTTSPLGAGVRGVDPGVRADQPAACVSTIRTRSPRTTRRLSREDQLDERRVLAEPRGELGARARPARRRPASPSVPRPSRRPSARSTTTSPSRELGALGDQLAEPVAGPDLGQAVDREQLDRASAPPSGRSSEAQRCRGVRRELGIAASAGRARRGRRRCRGRGQARGARRPAAPTPSRARQRRGGARGCPGRRRGRSRPAARAAARWSRCRGGRGSTPATGARSAPEGLGRARRRRAAGSRRAAARRSRCAARQRRIALRAPPPRSGRRRRDRRATSTPAARRRPRAAGSPLTTISALEPLAARRARRGRRRASPRPARRALGAGERLAEPALRRAEALHREDRGRVHGPLRRRSDAA